MAFSSPNVGQKDSLPPPVAHEPNLPKRNAMVRPGFGKDGQRIQLLSNHFSVRVASQDIVFYHYNVSIKSEDEQSVEGKGIGRKIMDKLYETYSSELSGKQFAYDGEKSLFTVGAFPQNKLVFKVVAEESSARPTCRSPGDGSLDDGGDRKRSKRIHCPRTFVVEISYAAKIPMRSIMLALKGSETEHTEDALRVLDIILRQQQAKRGCLLVRQSFFDGDHKNFAHLGGGVTGCRGFHSSFRTTHGGLSLNMDVSTIMIMKPGPVMDFLIENQNVKNPHDVDWTKAKKMLKNMRIKTRHTSMEFKIIGISEFPCNQQRFPLKVKDGRGEDQAVEVTVLEYFHEKRIHLTWSSNFPCLVVGKPNRPNYLPLELCDLISLQRYTKALSSQQRAALVEQSRQKPQERIKVVTDAVRRNQYDNVPLLSSCGVSIETHLTQLDGRVLTAPVLKLGNSEECFPRNGRWNFNNKKLWKPISIEHWAIVNFSARCDLNYLSRQVIYCGRNKGIEIARPHTLIEEDLRWIRSGPVVRVEKMFEQVISKLPDAPQFLLCVLPERKNSDIYGPWKKKNLHEFGIATQCVAPTKINDQYITNVLLKINSKLNGINSLLDVEACCSIPLVNEMPTMILGMDVSHGSPGRSDLSSIAAVVGSRSWPWLSRYRASVRTQSPKVEMVDSLYKPLADGNDDGIMRELLVDFYITSGQRKPGQIIIFRDGVSESQFNQVLNIELNQIIKAFYHLGENETTLPKFTVIIAQKNHHTKIFQANANENVPAGTVVDTKIVHPRNYDFYMCAHHGAIGTSRPTHYHVLLDEIGFAPDDLQKLVHSLSYVYQRSTTAISVVAPVCYAHLAAQQMSQFIKFDDFSETSSGQGETGGNAIIPELPRLHEKVRDSMFFC